MSDAKRPHKAVRMAMTKHPEWDEWEWLTQELPYSEIPGPDEAKHVYLTVLKKLYFDADGVAAEVFAELIDEANGYDGR